MILNRNGFVLPLGEKLYRVGATYAWKEINNFPTSEGFEQLIAIADNMLNIPFEVLEHDAGVRPASNDRRPVLGKHPLHDQLVVFNGLGSKGVLLAPYFAQHLAAHLYENHALMPEVDMNRYQSFFVDRVNFF
jgi:glycine oxidase